MHFNNKNLNLNIIQNEYSSYWDQLPATLAKMWRDGRESGLANMEIRKVCAFTRRNACKTKQANSQVKYSIEMCLLLAKIKLTSYHLHHSSKPASDTLRTYSKRCDFLKQLTALNVIEF